MTTMVRRMLAALGMTTLGMGAGRGTGGEKKMSYTVAKGNQRVDPAQLGEAGKIPWGVASMCAIAGCMPRVARGEDGILTWKQIEAVIRPKIYYDSQSALVCLENTNNMAGGTVYPTGQVDDICEHAHKMGLKVHLDGARIFNAATALGDHVAVMTRKVDSVMFCLSKGLGAPVGSMIVGGKALIEKGRVYRKMFGGGMRQAGVIAAAALIALEKSPALLHGDQENAKRLAGGNAAIPGLSMHPKKVRSNIVVYDCSKTAKTAVDFWHRPPPHHTLGHETG